MLPLAFPFYLAAEYEPLRGPYCVHIAGIASPVEVETVFVVGPAVAAPVDPEDPTGSAVSIVGQIYAAGIVEVEAGAVATTATAGATTSSTYTSGITENNDGQAAAQEACRDD